MSGWGARIVAELVVKQTGTHVLSVVHDGPVRVLLYGKLLIDARESVKAVKTSYAAGVSLTAGTALPLQVLYVRNARLADAIARPGEYVRVDGCRARL